jgi:alkylation response protein AidB-like acyl-CoA dehydrogenase
MTGTSRLPSSDTPRCLESAPLRIRRTTGRGYGFVRQLTADGKTNHLESIWRDSKVGEIYEGANEVQLWSIARVALGRDITG